MASYISASNPSVFDAVARTRVYFGTTLTDPNADTFREIGGVTSIPSLASKRETVIVNEYGSETKIPVKAGAEFATGTIECVNISGDLGQSEISAASAYVYGADVPYNLRIITSANKKIDVKVVVTSDSMQITNGMWVRSFDISCVSLPVVS